MKRTILLLLFLLLALGATLGVVHIRAARIEPGMLPKIVSFTATPRVVRPGDTVTVAWETRGTRSMAIEWGPTLHQREGMTRRSGLRPSGTMTDRPQETTIYVLECEDAFREVCTSASTTVMVK
jgi:hypothetical protein